jgi:hypothetical protein
MGLVLASLIAVPVRATPAEKVDGFVCPILGGKAGVNGKSQKIIQLPGGDYTVIGPDVRVPMHATNDNGAGSPRDSHASPGDSSYSPICARALRLCVMVRAGARRAGALFQWCTHIFEIY